MHTITIKDIAHEVGVSIATVSRAINDKDGIRKETRDKILQKVNELGYKANPIAKKLLLKKSFNIGVIVPEFINSFFPEVIIGIQEVLCEYGYQVIIMQSNESAETELKNINSMENQMVDGLIISLSGETSNITAIKRLVNNSEFPVVLFNRINDDLNTSKVVFNDYKWALFATEHLIEQGYKKIFHFSGPEHFKLMRDRIKGFKKAMKKHKLPYDETQVVTTGIQIEDGERVMRNLIKENSIPDAIFATNDPTAIGAMRVLKQHGYKIPEEVGIVGFSNSKMSEITTPTLTSVQQPTYEMGRKAANILLEQLQSSKQKKLQTIAMDGELIIRESSKKIQDKINNN